MHLSLGQYIVQQKVIITSTYIFQLRDLIRPFLNLLFLFVIKRFGAHSFTFSHPAFFRQAYGYAHEPVGLLFVHDSEPGMWELVFSNPCCSCRGHRVTLELWKPCLPDTPVFRLWVVCCFLSTTWYLREVYNLAWKLALREIQTCYKGDTMAKI